MNSSETLDRSALTRTAPAAEVRPIYLGRHVLGVAAILLGVCTLSWRDFDPNTWQQITPLGNVPHREILAWAVGTLDLSAGLAIQWRRTARAGALALAGIFLFFALMQVLAALGQPLQWNPWGSVFEQLSVVAGALIAYTSCDRREPQWAQRVARFAYLTFGICVLSFFFGVLPVTCKCHILRSGGIPAWFFPGKAFWAMMVILAYPLASVALLTGRFALLASRLLTAMIVVIGVVYWLPAPFITHLYSDPHVDWVGNAQNLAIGAGAWIVADFLGRRSAAAR
jgi:uncharacterized membrane protein YphA (DoxX/SURF4 family)